MNKVYTINDLRIGLLLKSTSKDDSVRYRRIISLTPFVYVLYEFNMWEKPPFAFSKEEIVILLNNNRIHEVD